MELTINTFFGKWAVINKSYTTPVILIECDSAEEAMNILQQLNGQTFEVINAFCQTRKRLGCA